MPARNGCDSARELAPRPVDDGADEEDETGVIQTTFSRVAIVNRGESAMRLIHAVRELNAQYGLGLTTIALHTEGERSAMFAREADEAYNLGPASARPSLSRPDAPALAGARGSRRRRPRSARSHRGSRTAASDRRVQGGSPRQPFACERR